MQVMKIYETQSSINLILKDRIEIKKNKKTEKKKQNIILMNSVFMSKGKVKSLSFLVFFINMNIL
jgi:hypothetical protein